MLRNTPLRLREFWREIEVLAFLRHSVTFPGSPSLAKFAFIANPANRRVSASWAPPKPHRSPIPAAGGSNRLESEQQPGRRLLLLWRGATRARNPHDLQATRFPAVVGAQLVLSRCSAGAQPVLSRCSAGAPARGSVAHQFGRVCQKRAQPVTAHHQQSCGEQSAQRTREACCAQQAGAAPFSFTDARGELRDGCKEELERAYSGGRHGRGSRRRALRRRLRVRSRTEARTGRGGPDGADRTERPGLWRYSCGFGESKFSAASA